MKFFGRTLAVIFSMALLGVLGVGGYFALTFFMELFRRMDYQVAVVTTIASVVPLLAAKIIASSIRQASQQNTAHQLHAEKTATYQLFIDLWRDLLRHGRDSEDRSSHTWSEEVLALDCRLSLYGSSGVVKAHAVLRALERDHGAHNPRVRSQVATVLMAIRQDLGLETQGLTAEELLPLLCADSVKTSAPTNASAFQDRIPRVPLVSIARGETVNIPC
jgi:hypothetical protein